MFSFWLRRDFGPPPRSGSHATFEMPGSMLCLHLVSRRDDWMMIGFVASRGLFGWRNDRNGRMHALLKSRSRWHALVATLDGTPSWRARLRGGEGTASTG